jgi:thermitase
MFYTEDNIFLSIFSTYIMRTHSRLFLSPRFSASFGVLVLLAIFWLVSAHVTPAAGQTPVPPTEYVSGEVIVKLRNTASINMANHAAVLQQLQSKQPAIPLQGIRPLSGDNTFVIDIEDDRDASNVAKAYGALAEVEYAEPNYMMRTTRTPNDPLYGSQYYLNHSGDVDINAPQAWDVTVGSPSVVIAVLDTGIDMDNAEFTGKLVSGRDFIDGDTNPDTDPGPDAEGAHHGTSVAGIIAANSNNSLLMAGTCWSCKIMPVRVLNDEGVGNTETVSNGINWAVDRGAKVINLSLVGTQNSTIATAVKRAFDSGVVVVAAAGNSNLNLNTSPMSPISDDGAKNMVLGVGSINSSNAKSSFSNYGHAVDVSAPGEGIVSIKYVGNGYTSTHGTFQGTSYSTPIVSGIVGLLRTQFPHDTPTQIINRVRQNVNPFATGTTNMGTGRPDAAKALSRTSGMIVTAPGPGGGPHIRAFTPAGSADPTTNFFAYDKAFTGGVYVATGDIDADGADEIIVGAGAGGGPHLRVFERDGEQRGIQFFPFHPDFRGGLSVASGDVDGDGKNEIGVCQASGGQAWAKVYRYNNKQEILAYVNVFGSAEVGCHLAFGDIDGDGKDELIVGAGKGGGPHIRVYDIGSTPVSGPNQGATLKPISFFAFHPLNRSGISVAAGDVDGDGKAEIAVSQLEGDEAWVKVYRYNNLQTVLGNWRAYPAGVTSGAYVSMGDVDYDGLADVITGPGQGGGPQIRAFKANGTPLSVNFFAYDPAFRGGARPGFATF